ncbi:MAG TPA: chemotaxis protein CheA [Melioribacteraceae bacterium]|nr:chemotaxis protein CheA [Melioribacteraceae bacterium]
MEDDSKVFYEETNELIQALEKQILKLEKYPHDIVIIQEVFRLLHTIKGNAGMFGLTGVSDFAHLIESIYNLIRNNQIIINKQIINNSIESVDILNVLLNNGNQVPDIIKFRLDKIKNEFEHLLIQYRISKEKSTVATKSESINKISVKKEDSMSEIHKQAFIEEATELISELEKSLLELEKDKTNKDLISKIFRAMHTIKGSAAMFGFDDISVFTHDIESVYDLIRNSELSVNKNIIDLTLLAVDQISNMLKPDGNGTNENEAVTKQILSSFRDILNNHKVLNALSADEIDAKKISSSNFPKKIYHIFIEPNADIMGNGTNLLSLIKELRDFGESYIKACLDKSINMENINSEKCYTKWQLILKCDKDIDSIKDVFMFVEDDCKLVIKENNDKTLLENDEQFYLFCKTFEEKEFDFNYDINKEIEYFLGGDLFGLGALPKTIKNEVKTPKNTEIEKVSSIRVSSEKLDELVNLVGELVTVQARLSSIANNLSDPNLIAVSEEVERITWSLRDSALNIRMLPIGTLFNKFNRLIRDLSKDLNKEVNLTIEGAETELDKTVIEKLNDPLIHILRNSIDHGIESPEQRLTLNKSEIGEIHLSASQSGGEVLIKISDDGAGLNKDAIKQKAISQGLITEGTELSENELFGLIFQPGFSTAKKVTNVSGRGVGMDVVKKAIELLRGSIEVTSKPNLGTTITLKLPLTLAIIDGLLVDINNSNFILPLSSVEECVELVEKDIENAHGRNFINIRDEIIPYVNLRERFYIEGTKPDIEQVVIASVNNVKCGFVVDKVVGQHQTVLKTLGKVYKKVEGISGATILGDGTVALILDIAKLVEQEITIAKETY